MHESDLSYIAGLFDGEGSASLQMVKATKNGKRYPRLYCRLAQNDRTVLDWIQSEFGCGKVRLKSGSTKCHDLVFAYRQARIFLTAIEPYLRVKQSHVTELLDEAGRERPHGVLVNT